MKFPNVLFVVIGHRINRFHVWLTRFELQTNISFYYCFLSYRFLIYVIVTYYVWKTFSKFSPFGQSGKDFHHYKENIVGISSRRVCCISQSAAGTSNDSPLAPTSGIRPSVSSTVVFAVFCCKKTWFYFFIWHVFDLNYGNKFHACS